MDEHTKKAGRPGWVNKAVLGIAAAASIYTYANWDWLAPQIIGPSAYTCQNLTYDVVRISEGNPGILNIKVIGVTQEKEVHRSTQKIECTGTAILSSGEKLPIKYRAEEDGNQWFIFYEPDI